MVSRKTCLAAAALATALSARGDTQVWNDGGADNVWSTNAANWADGTVWTNGNRAVFAGAGGTAPGETVDISATVTVASVTFLTNGYVIADANSDGALSFVGGPTVISVSNAGDTAVIGAAIGGGGGLTKTGPGVLQLKGTNTYTGVTTVSAGTLKLNPATPEALGTGYAGNETVVADGATLDLNGCYCLLNGVGTGTVSRFEDVIISGSGVGGQGALVNNGWGLINGGLRNLTLAGNAVIGGSARLDLGGNGSFAGNGYTLTKTGSCEVAISRTLNNSPIVIAAGTCIVQTQTGFGGTDYPTTLNGGIINLYVKDMSFAERFYLNGGRFRRSGQIGTNTFSGTLTFGNWTAIEVDNATNTVLLTGLLEGAGGFSLSGPGALYVTGTSNTYSGATANSGLLVLGRPNLYAGSLGSGVVTNSGTVYCYSGRLGSGNFVNNNLLYFDATNSFAVSNNLLGGGTGYLRYGGRMTLDGNASTCGTFRLSSGSLSLTNGASLYASSEFSVADRLSGNYPVDPTNVTAALTIYGGSSLTAKALIVGNGNNVAGGGMTGAVNQVGGTVSTFGWNGDPVTFPGEYDGVRIAHFGQANGTYNMMGGTLRVENGYRLTVATDGTGYFHQTGGEVFTPQFIVNDRNQTTGYGHALLEGGTLNVGSNGITAGTGAPYLLEYGGLGCVVRAMTNFTSSLNATLFGSNANAVTFDTTNWTITLSGRLTGAGGLNKRGAGALALSGTNTYSGPTCLYAGSVAPTLASSLSTNSVVAFGVSADGTGGRLTLPDGFSLAKLTVGVANPEALDAHKTYPILSWSGTLAGTFGASALPGPWYVYYDRNNRFAELRAAIGTLILMH